MEFCFLIRALGAVVLFATVISVEVVFDVSNDHDLLASIDHDWLESDLLQEALLHSDDERPRQAQLFFMPDPHVLEDSKDSKRPSLLTTPFNSNSHHVHVKQANSRANRHEASKKFGEEERKQKRQARQFSALGTNDAIPAMSSCGSGRKLIALTFDDGPREKYTDTVRKELAKLGVKATFFLSPLASADNEQEQCRTAHRLVKDGHELQLHSLTHPHLPEVDRKRLDYELQGTINWMEKCGLPRPNMFRPPYGELLPQQARYVHDTYGTIIAQWNIGSRDHQIELTQMDVVRIVQESFENTVGNGHSAVILMHDFYAARRPGVITQVVQYFRDRGYSFVTMNQCYNACQSVVCTGRGGPTPYKNVYIP